MFPLTDVCRISRHGVVIPSLPKELIRNLAQQFSSKPITKDTLPSLEKATDEFFRTISYPPTFSELTFRSDLSMFARHAGRKAIEEGDVQMLLQRSLRYIYIILMIDNVWLKGVVGLRCLFLALRRDIYRGSYLDGLGWSSLLNEREGPEKCERLRMGEMFNIVNCLVL
jgi:histone H3/H4